MRNNKWEESTSLFNSDIKTTNKRKRKVKIKRKFKKCLFLFYVLVFSFLSIAIIIYLLIKYSPLISNNYLKNTLLKRVNDTYKKNEFVNINEIESTILGGRPWIKGQNKAKEINIGIGIDPNYTLHAMMTLSSAMDSQKDETKLRIHIAVVNGFPVENMIEIYTLRERIRNDVEFNFYNAKRVETELKGVHTKGNGVMAKIVLAILLPNDVERIIILDTGDLLVLRDLSEMYN